MPCRIWYNGGISPYEKEGESMKKTALILSLILVFSSFAAADIYVKTKTHNDAFSAMGQNRPATDTISEQWIGDDQFATISDKSASIIDLKKNTYVMINHKSKTYIEGSLPFDLTKFLPAQAMAMAGMMKMTVTVTPTGAKKTIGQWACDEYDVTTSIMGMTIKTKVYAAKNVPFDLNAYREKFAATLMKGTSVGIDDAAVKEMMKVDGFQIASETTSEMMGAKMHQTTEVLEIAKKAAPAGIYSVPAGYTKQATLSMQDMQDLQR
jgi:hypothetical protein